MKQRKEYYSQEHLEKIKEYLNNENYEKALKEFQLYFQNYPEDAIAYIYFVDLLIKIGKFEEAERLFEDMKNMSNFNRVGFHFYHTLLIKLKFIEKDFKTAYELLEKTNLEHLDEIDLVSILKWNHDKKYNNFINNGYLMQQIIDYQENRFIKHIQKHLYTSSIAYISKFNEDFPIYEVLEQIKPMLPTTHAIYRSISCYYAFFKYDACGKSKEGENLDYFRVIALNPTNEIITIYPCQHNGHIGYTDLNVKKEITDTPILRKEKRLSQIEKFNKKYGM